MNKIKTKRSDQTRLLIMNAFVDIMQNKNLENITVKSIVTQANITRGTFYLYFADINELVICIEELLLQQMPQLSKSANISGFSKYPSLEECAPTQWELAIFEYYNKYSKWLNALLGFHGDPSFYPKIKEKIQASLITQMQMDGAPNDSYRERFIDMIADVFLNLAKTCNQDDIPKLANIMSTIRIGSKYKSTIERMNDQKKL